MNDFLILPLSNRFWYHLRYLVPEFFLIGSNEVLSGNSRTSGFYMTWNLRANLALNLTETGSRDPRRQKFHFLRYPTARFTFRSQSEIMRFYYMIISWVFHTYIKRFRNKINLAIILFLYRAVFLYITFWQVSLQKIWN